MLCTDVGRYVNKFIQIYKIAKNNNNDDDNDLY